MVWTGRLLNRQTILTSGALLLAIMTGMFFSGCYVPQVGMEFGLTSTMVFQDVTGSGYQENILTMIPAKVNNGWGLLFVPEYLQHKDSLVAYDELAVNLGFGYTKNIVGDFRFNINISYREGRADFEAVTFDNNLDGTDNEKFVAEQQTSKTTGFEYKGELLTPSGWGYYMKVKFVSIPLEGEYTHTVRDWDTFERQTITEQTTENIVLQFLGLGFTYNFF